MNTSIFERQRTALETVDLTEYLVSELLAKPPKRIYERIAQEHSIRRLLENAVRAAQFLSDSFGLVDTSDENPFILERTKELSVLEVSTETSEFYSRLRSIRETHRSHPDEPAEWLMDELLAIKDLRIGKDSNNFLETETMFSGDEGYGRFLDLNLAHSAYLNLKHIALIDYLSYLDKITLFEEIPKETKRSSSYMKYLDDLYNYLTTFLSKAKPLIDLKLLKKTMDDEFSKLVETEMLVFPSIMFICSVCGKSFEKDTVYQAHLKSEKHLKKAKYATSASKPESEQKDYGEVVSQKSREEMVAHAEFRVHYLLSNVLSMELSATKGNVERKQSSLITEIDAKKEEVEELDTNALKQDLEKFEAHLTKTQEEKLYNPLRLPLGWDGKPIPYWLYKLHGLGVSYTCEICGNYIYMGRRVFDKHFQEWRHSYGMKCLGIPNTRHFQDITQISDAYALWEKLKKASKTETFKSDTMEEYEDLEGNVYNKKTFEDLHRQGLL